MGVRRVQVEEVARLARLRLTPAEAQQLASELDAILDHFQALSAVRLDDAEPVEGVIDSAAAPRPDVAGAEPLHIPVAELAAEWTDGFLTLPRLSAMGGEDAQADVIHGATA